MLMHFLGLVCDACDGKSWILLAISIVCTCRRYEMVCSHPLWYRMAILAFYYVFIFLKTLEICIEGIAYAERYFLQQTCFKPHTFPRIQLKLHHLIIILCCLPEGGGGERERERE